MIQNRIIVSLAAVVVLHMICSINAFHTTLGISSSSSSSRRHTSTFSKSMNDHHHYNDRNTATRATKLNLSPWNNNNDNDDDESDSSKTKGNNNSTLKKAITIISSIGVIETLYLTWSKISSSNVLFCNDDITALGGCSDVLNGPYSSLLSIDLGGGKMFDVPLSVLGVIAYSAVTFLSLNQIKKDEVLLLITISMASFSSILVYLLLFVIHDICPYCFLSASLSITLSILAFRVTLGKENNKEYLQSTIPKVFASVLATALSSVLLFSNISNQPSSYATAKSTVITVPSEEVQYYTPPKMTTTSSSNALQIAKTLKSLDSKMYGAYWCSHCYEQKQTLGKEAFQKGYITYIECDKEGYESQRSLCKERKVPGYPTWEIGGKLFPGEQSLEELGDIADEMKSALNAN